MKLKQRSNPPTLIDGPQQPKTKSSVLGGWKVAARTPAVTTDRAPWNVQRSACIRPDSAFVSKTRSATIAGTSASDERDGREPRQGVQEHEGDGVDDRTAPRTRPWRRP